uniref:30S ribosomal protein S6, chloroplastic n=1 Tax=Gronococcus sybilensis TaxID=3028029 RepID=A0A9Y1I2H8_9RHOD|nr:ribosomal protein S6 [Gronococcus sybilensis]
MYLYMYGTYELIYIINSNLSEENIHQTILKYSTLLADNKGYSIESTNKGLRRFAYAMRNGYEEAQDGYYIQVDFRGTNITIEAVKKDMNISEEVLRYNLYRKL